jgi:hypothetical protein
MVRSIYIGSLLTLLLLLSGCTRNNGDIGNLFGTWRLETMTKNGEEVDLYSNLTKVYTWAFQSHIVRIQDIRDNMDYVNYYGSWCKEKDVLILDFTYEDENGNGEYLPPSPLHLNADGITRLDVNQTSSKEMKLSYRSVDDVEYSYYLRKIP